MNDPRLDKLLWSLRVFKTRPLATAACRSGHVRIGELEAKPGRDVHVGEVLVLDPDPAIRGAHLGLIEEVLRGFSGIADFSEIVTA